ncbi:MAG TPA: glycosyltransferase [Solirubrobacteraceae bacterium]|nr:glycosyltransferase [Solirubrobacteraceae bacterium]
MTRPGPRVDVVVSTRDRAMRLRALLEALIGQDVGREAFTVTVVDNGSRDATATVLARAARDGHLDLRVLRRPRGDGPAHGRDAGWRAGAAPLVAFTDDDCRPEPGWLAALLEAARARPTALLAGRTDPDPAELHRLAPTARTQTVHEAGPWFPTCNIAYPRALLERLGGFDLRYGWGGEDTDLAWRAQAASTPVAYVEGARVLHAVEDLGALGALRLAGRWSDAMRVFAAHPQMRHQALYHGVFWRRAHRDLLLAAAGLALAQRLPAAVVLALPWLHGARRRLWLSGGGARQMPLLLAIDAAEIAAVVRGGVRYRVAVV